VYACLHGFPHARRVYIAEVLRVVLLNRNRLHPLPALYFLSDLLQYRDKMNNTTPIAVIGIGCRFPGGVSNPEELWDLLSEGRSGWGEVPADRWNAEAFYNPEKEAKESVNCKSGYFLQQDVSLFDAKFFNIVPYEAHSIDPQQRLLLETTYEALENAGIPIDTLRGSDTSVFVGVYARDYDRMGYKDLAEISKHHSTGTGEALLSNRISYLFDLKGASMTIDTGCVRLVLGSSLSLQALTDNPTVCKRISSPPSMSNLEGGGIAGINCFRGRTLAAP
jgi:acyl transferase domain-containing protein